MEPSEDTDDAVERKYSELCLDLNMDKRTKEESWESYQKILTKYTLEASVFVLNGDCLAYSNAIAV
jgi:hypothetical protein